MAHAIPLRQVLTRLVAVSVLPVFLFAAWLAYAGVREQQLETDREAANLARNFAASLDQHLAARIAALTVLADVSLLASDSGRQRLYREARAFQEQFGAHIVLAAVGEPVRMLFNTRLPYGAPLPTLPRPSGFAAFPAAVASRQPAVGDVFFGPIAHEALVALAVPLLSGNTVSHVLLATFDTAHFRKRAELLSLPAGWRVRLLDGTESPISERGQPFGNSDDTVDSFRYRHPLQVARWSVEVAIPKPIYRAALYKSGITLALGLLAIALITVTVATRASRRLGRAVASLARPGLPAGQEAQIQEVLAVRQRLDETDRLRDANEALEQRVAERTTELAAARDRIARFAIDQERHIEDERRRVAREVHDQLGQIFTGLQIIVSTLPHEALAPEQSTALEQALDVGLASTRRITADLRPPLLDDLGFAAAIEHLVREAGRTAGFDVVLHFANRPPSAEQALLLYRIVQEAVTNIMRHAQARRVAIAGEPDGDDYRLRIDDDGSGFDPAAVRPGAMGLLNMRERAALLGGSCRIENRPEGGTRVEVRLPLQAQGDNRDTEAAAC